MNLHALQDEKETGCNRFRHISGFTNLKNTNTGLKLLSALLVQCSLNPTQQFTYNLAPGPRC